MFWPWVKVGRMEGWENRWMGGDWRSGEGLMMGDG